MANKKKGGVIAVAFLAVAMTIVGIQTDRYNEDCKQKEKIAERLRYSGVKLDDSPSAGYFADVEEAVIELDAQAEQTVEIVRNTTSFTTAALEAAVEAIPVYSYTEEELDAFAHLLYAEAGADWVSDDTIRMVGSVTLNRVFSDWYPDTLLGVIYQSGQYSTAKTMMYKTPTERCYRIAEELLQDGSILPENVVYQSQEAQGNGIYCESDGEIFCYR